MRAYKFLESRFALESIQKRRLKISQIADLNDPFELFPFELTDKLWRQTLKESKEELSRNRGILCFSAEWSDPVIWAHYSSKHTGICIGFEIPDELTRKVTYVRRRLRCPNTFAEFDMEKMLFTKFHNWSYEKEIRVWANLEDKEGEFYFASIDGETLKIIEVIAGARCTVSKASILESLGELSSSTNVIKARPGFKRFEIVVDRRGF